MVEAAGPNEAPFLADCYKAMLDEAGLTSGLRPDWHERLVRYFQRGMADGTQGWFVAREPGGAPYGSACVFLSETSTVQLRPWATLAGVYVKPEMRRRGTARALTLAAIAWARDRNCAVVRLTASEPAESLYRSLGFTPGRELVLRLS